MNMFNSSDSMSKNFLDQFWKFRRKNNFFANTSYSAISLKKVYKKKTQLNL